MVAGIFYAFQTSPKLKEYRWSRRVNGAKAALRDDGQGTPNEETESLPKPCLPPIIVAKQRAVGVWDCASPKCDGRDGHLTVAAVLDAQHGISGQPAALYGRLSECSALKGLPPLRFAGTLFGCPHKGNTRRCFCGAPLRH